VKTPPFREVHIFPLNTVLFPGGLLPLKVFEQRYIEMTKTCLRDGRPFGVCLIREGREVGAAAVPEPVGCLASIEHWEMPQLGVFHLIARGGQRFRIRDRRVAANHLVSAAIELIPPDTGTDAVEPLCRDVMKALVEQVGADRFPAPVRLDDAAWIGYRLAEALPLEARERQALLEMSDAGQRLERLRTLLVQQGISAPRRSGDS
jgi:Lon protease-like protein